jgi:hypothetical protein
MELLLRMLDMYTAFCVLFSVLGIIARMYMHMHHTYKPNWQYTQVSLFPLHAMGAKEQEQYA